MEKKEAQKNLQDLKANIALDNKDYKTYEKIMLEIYQDYSNEKQPQPIHMFTLARLYNKIGDKKNAKIWAEKSIGLAKASGQDSSEAEKFLKNL